MEAPLALSISKRNILRKVIANANINQVSNTNMLHSIKTKFITTQIFNKNKS
jgi:hypothetical protein